MNRYPSDEELNSFIEKMEKEELYAPNHLKDDILQKVQKLYNSQDTEISASDFQKSRKKSSRTVQFFSDSLKIIAGMAAAIILIFTVPMTGSSDHDMQARYERQEEQIMKELKKDEAEKQKDVENNLFYKLDQGSKAIGNLTSEFFGQVNQLFKSDGGKENEN